MAFNRIGTPVDLNLVAFDGTNGVAIMCNQCGRRAGTKIKRLAKFDGNDSVVVSPQEFICPHCGKKSGMGSGK